MVLIWMHIWHQIFNFLEMSDTIRKNIPAFFNFLVSVHGTWFQLHCSPGGIISCNSETFCRIAWLFETHLAYRLEQMSRHWRLVTRHAPVLFHTWWWEMFLSRTINGNYEENCREKRIWKASMNDSHFLIRQWSSFKDLPDSKITLRLACHPPSRP